MIKLVHVIFTFFFKSHSNNSAQACFWGKEEKMKVFWSHPNSCPFLSHVQTRYSEKYVFLFHEWWEKKKTVPFYGSHLQILTVSLTVLGSFPYHMYAWHCTTLELPTSTVYWYDYSTKDVALPIITHICFCTQFKNKLNKTLMICLLLFYGNQPSVVGHLMIWVMWF